MKSCLFISSLVALWAAAQGSASSPLKNGFLLTNDQDPPLIPEIHGIGMLESKVVQDLVDEPEGGRAPIVPHGATEWKGKSQIPLLLQWFLAGLWVAMLASLPFIIPVIDQKPVTMTQKTVGGSMLVVLFGGFYLFTNVILFQSVHFKTVRPLTIVECIYLMSQLITTVGYGDITPAKIRGQVFVGLYVLGALFVIAMLVSDVTAHVVRMAQEYKAKRFATNHPDYHDDRVKDVASLIKPKRPSVLPLLTAIAVFTAIDIIWIIFFSTFPGENKTVFQATYMSVITLSTVGLGYFTPLTEAGMIFGAFFMLIGSAALLGVIGNFTELMVNLTQYERFKEDSKEEALHRLKTVAQGSDEVTDLQFYQFTLSHTGVSQGTLDHIHEAFERLKPSSGKVSFAAVQKALEESPMSPRPE